MKYLITIVVILCVIANSTYAIEHSALSNEFTLDTRRIQMEHSALSNIFTLDTRDHIPIEHSVLSNIFALDTLDFSMLDLNKDEIVNILDMVILVKNFGKIGNVSGDVNGDGKVDKLDLDMLSNHFGEK